MARVGIIVISYVSDPQPLFSSVLKSKHEVRWYLFVHGQDLVLRHQLDAFAGANNCRYFPYGINRGLTRSWNEGLLASFGDGNDVTLIVNDDLYFYEGGFDQFIQFILSARQRTPGFGAIMTYGMEPADSAPGGAGNTMLRRKLAYGACFALGRSAIDTIGFFDQNYWPAYFEDSDYFYRMGLAGVPILCDERTVLQHQRSSTVRRDRMISLLYPERFQRNEEYYERKWGGGRGTERFATPFDDPSLDLCISAEQRAAPYGNHDRRDLATAGSAGFLHGSLREDVLALLQRCGGRGRRWLVWGGNEIVPVLIQHACLCGAEIFLVIDHDRERLQRTAADVSRHPFLHFRFVACDDADAIGAAEADLGYIAYPLRLKTKFDAIVVAGRWRMECAAVAAAVAAADALVVIIDEERSRDDAVRGFLAGRDSKSTVDAAAVFGNWQAARDAALQACFDTVEQNGQFLVLRRKPQRAASPARPEGGA